MIHTTYLGLGSNLGEKEKNIRQALKKIEEKIGHVVRHSAYYYSEPWGFQSDNAFVNIVACCETECTPRELLQKTQLIEREMGRRQKSENGQYHDRIIDIDILYFDELTIDEPDLKIPHPLIHQREFVTIPLSEIL